MTETTEREYVLTESRIKEVCEVIVNCGLSYDDAVEYALDLAKECYVPRAIDDMRIYWPPSILRCECVVIDGNDRWGDN